MLTWDRVTTHATIPESAAGAAPEGDKVAVPSRARRVVVRRALLRALPLPPLLGLLLFAPAGTFDYWQAWLYLALLGIAMGAMISHLAWRDPEFLGRRLQLREERRSQRWLQLVGIPVYLAIFVLPALDRRFGWSAPPAWLAVVADAVMLAAYAAVGWVFHVNRFAGRTLRVDGQQQVIDRGPYRVVRHPMYLGVLVMMGITPLALGSAWGLLVAFPLALLLAYRIVDEERMLRQELPGYDAYAHRTRYRLLPGVW